MTQLAGGPVDVYAAGDIRQRRALQQILRSVTGLTGGTGVVWGDDGLNSLVGLGPTLELSTSVTGVVTLGVVADPLEQEAMNMLYEILGELRTIRTALEEIVGDEVDPETDSDSPLAMEVNMIRQLVMETV